MKNEFSKRASRWTRACKQVRVLTGVKSKRCVHCPFEDCLLANPKLARRVFKAKIAELLDAFGYTEKMTIGTIIKRGE